MQIRHGSLKVAALAVVVSLPLLALSGTASATAARTRTAAAVGSAKWCAHHRARAKTVASCQSAAGTGGATGTGATGGPAITVQIDPDPLVETGSSTVEAVVQVESSPAFAGDPVLLTSSQLDASCDGEIVYLVPEQVDGSNPLTVPLVLDDDGNASVAIFAQECAPGTDLIEADLEVAPYDTALGTLVADPPVVTTPGLVGVPTTSGTVTTGEVETGDSAASGDSDVYAVFYVETDPVYAEQTVEISSDQLFTRCQASEAWAAPLSDGFEVYSYTGGLPQAPFTDTLDDDGNAAFIFVGSSCAAGTSEVIADVEAGSHPTYTTTFTIIAPEPTI